MKVYVPFSGVLKFIRILICYWMLTTKSDVSCITHWRPILPSIVLPDQCSLRLLRFISSVLCRPIFGVEDKSYDKLFLGMTLRLAVTRSSHPVENKRRLVTFCLSFFSLKVIFLAACTCDTSMAWEHPLVCQPSQTMFLSLASSATSWIGTRGLRSLRWGVIFVTSQDKIRVNTSHCTVSHPSSPLLGPLFTRLWWLPFLSTQVRQASPFSLPPSLFSIIAKSAIKCWRNRDLPGQIETWCYKLHFCFRKILWSFRKI